MSTSQPDLRLVENEPEGPDLNLGKTLDGRYHIERLLGKGGMGLVYEAKHVVLQKRLAVKVLKEEVSRDEKVMARFRREAQAAGSIGSPHICDVSDFGTMPDGSTYFVMEFLDGPSLSGALLQENPMQTARVLDVAIQLCEALGAAHERGIVHRDLKPDNVHLVDQGGRKDFVKVLDFGIAKVAGAADKKLTQAGQVFGTPHYMSPEQCAGREVDLRTDIYALGVMIYEMACGVVPFDADNLMGVLTKHVYENPIPPRQLPPPVAVPPGLEAIILKSLAKQPEHRYQTMAELREDLVTLQQGGTPKAVMESVGGGGVPKTQMLGSDVSALIGAYPATPSAAPPAMPEEESKPPVLLIVGGLVLLLGLGAAVFAAAFFLGGDTDGEEGTVAQTESDPTPPPADPPADPPPVVEANTPTEPGATEPAEPAEPAQPEVVMVTLESEPAGCEVYAEDGSLMGNAPVELPRPAEGDEPVRLTLRFAGYQDREVPISHLTSEHLTITLDRRRGRRGRVRPQPRVTAPQVRSLGTPAPSRPPPRPSGGEIVNPW